ncbi:MAG TPA: hypothetical protein PKW90_16575, partial [Myxococcota bacterium]|nr:hypothetical protein [Myxococcota bacterium]
ADFGFLQVQTATYRIREHIVGRDAAMRMSGSPLMADLSQLISADGSPEQLAKFFDELKKAASTDTTAPKTTAWKTRGIRFAMPKAIIDAKLGFFEADPAVYSNALATNKSVSSGAIMEAVTIAPAPASVGTAKTSLAGSWMTAIGVPKYSTYSSGALAMLGGAGGALSFASSTQSPSASSSPALTVARRMAVAVKQGAPSMKELNTESISVAQLIHNHVKLQKERPVAWTLRGSRITDRVKVSAGVEMREVAFRLRASVLRTVYELDIHKDDLPFPGFLSFKNKAGTVVPLKDVTETTEGNYISESRAFPLAKADAEALLREVEQGLHDLSTPDADPPALFSDAIRSLELTAAILRTLEGRIKEVREAADACRKVQVQIEQLIDAVEERHKEVREALLESRHDVTVTAAPSSSTAPLYVCWPALSVRAAQRTHSDGAATARPAGSPGAATAGASGPAHPARRPGRGATAPPHPAALRGPAGRAGRACWRSACWRRRAPRRVREPDRRLPLHASDGRPQRELRRTESSSGARSRGAPDPAPRRSARRSRSRRAG